MYDNLCNITTAEDYIEAPVPEPRGALALQNAIVPFSTIHHAHVASSCPVFYIQQDTAHKDGGPMELELTTVKQGCVVVVSLVGSINTLTAEKVSIYLDSRVKEGQTCLIADLSQLEYMNSAGLRVILAILKEARRLGGDFRLAATQKNVKEVLTSTGFNRIVKMYPKVETAVASFAESA